MTIQRKKEVCASETLDIEDFTNGTAEEISKKFLDFEKKCKERGFIRVVFSGDHDYDYYNFYCEKYRLETNKEYNKRIEQEEKKKKENAQKTIQKINKKMEELKKLKSQLPAELLEKIDS